MATFYALRCWRAFKRPTLWYSTSNQFSATRPPVPPEFCGHAHLCGHTRATVSWGFALQRQEACPSLQSTQSDKGQSRGCADAPEPADDRVVLPVSPGTHVVHVWHQVPQPLVSADIRNENQLVRSCQYLPLCRKKHRVGSHGGAQQPRKAGLKMSAP